MSAVKILEDLPLTRFHYLLLAISSLVYALTAMNVMLIGGALPAIIKDWGLGTAEAGILLSFGYLGMFFGAIMSGVIADRVGRKVTMIVMIAVGSIFTGLCGLAWNFWSMAFLRLIAGIGLGGTLPLPGVYMSEYPPARYRGRFVGIVETAWVYGALLALTLARVIMPEIGWRSVFTSAYIPLILIPVIALYAPESIRFLEKKERLDEIKRIFSKYSLVEKVEELELRVEKVEKVSPRILLSSTYVKRTIVLWILWAVLVYTYHGIFIWLPSIYATLFGYGVVKSLEWAFAITLIQIPGYYSAAFLLDRVGRKDVLVAYLATAGIGCILLASTTEIGLILIFSAIISFFNLGAWAGLYTYTPELYPTELRGTGSGVAASIGRLAGILGPFVTGYLFDVSGGQLLPAFTVFALAHLIAAASTGILGEETKGRTLEEIAG